MSKTVCNIFSMVSESFIFVVYESFILELWYLHCTLTLVLVLRRYKLKYGLISNHLFQTTQERGRWKQNNLRVTINFCEKTCLSVATWNKIDISQQVVPITYTLEKRFFAVALRLKVYESFLFRQSKKTCYILWSVWVFFWTFGEEKTK